MSTEEHNAMLRKMEAILVRIGVSCTRKQAKKSGCITCVEMYRRFDMLKRHSGDKKP